jgi:hypothetical protein
MRGEQNSNLEFLGLAPVVNSQYGVYPARRFKMQIKSFGILSNFAEVEITNPVALIQGKEKHYKYSRKDLAITSAGNAYILTNEGVIEETLDWQFKQQKIANLPVDFSKRIQFIWHVVEGGFVIGGGGTNNLGAFSDLYYFSIEKLQWEKLPDLPEPFTSFKLVNSKNGFLVFEDALKVFSEAQGEKWTLNLQSKVWERLVTDPRRFFNLQSFYYNGESFAFGIEYMSSSRAFYRMKNDFSWEVYFETPNFQENSEFSTPLVIGGKYYIFSYRLGYIAEFDLNSKSLKSYPFPFSHFSGNIPVKYSDGIFTLSGGDRDNIYEDIRLDLY